MRHSKLGRVFGYNDFRLLWIGAFLSFTGSWIQKIAEGYFVYQITHDESKLALVSFCNSVPVFIFGFVAGSFADTMNKRRVLVVTAIIYTIGAMYLSVATAFHFVQYWHIVAVALITGLVSCVEMPTRQSMVSRVVPADDLAAAVPINAMTFNAARILGPAIGGLVLTYMGVAACYLMNGISFLAIIWAAIAIKADTSVPPRSPQPVMDLVMEGALYTWREPRLRTLLLMETVTAFFGIFYMALIPAYVDQGLGFGVGTSASAAVISHAYTMTGVGAVAGLILMTVLSDTPHRARLLRFSMLFIGLGLVAMSLFRSALLAYLLMLVVGGCTILQFNGTNALFQILAPERLRGRVLSMHIWALNGISPFGVLLFGWLANVTRLAAGPHAHLGLLPTSGIRLSLLLGGCCVLLGALGAFLSRTGLSGLSDGPPPEVAAAG